MPAHLYALDDALLVHLLSFCAARDVEATTKASRVVALHLLPQYPEIWRVLFVRQWGKLNFKLDAVTEDARNLQIDSRLRELFPAYVETLCIVLLVGTTDTHILLNYLQ